MRGRRVGKLVPSVADSQTLALGLVLLILIAVRALFSCMELQVTQLNSPHYIVALADGGELCGNNVGPGPWQECPLPSALRPFPPDPCYPHSVIFVPRAPEAPLLASLL